MYCTSQKLLSLYAYKTFPGGTRGKDRQRRQLHAGVAAAYEAMIPQGKDKGNVPNVICDGPRRGQRLGHRARVYFSPPLARALIAITIA